MKVTVKKPKESLKHFVSKETRPVVYVDYRESKLIRHLSESDLVVHSVTLKVGDIIISDRVCAERKTTSDFLQSIIDGRLFTQAAELISNFQRPLIVIEGSNLFSLRNIHPNAIKGALSSLMVDYRIPIVWTKDEADTVEFIASLARREQIDKKRSVSLRGSKKSKNINEILAFIVSGFPDIDIKLSSRILEHFGSLKNFVNATEDELKAVDGIGREKAKKLKNLFEVIYGSR